MYVKSVALQWIFAFTIMAVLFVLSLAVCAPQFFRKEDRPAAPDGDRERQPLLSES